MEMSTSRLNARHNDKMRPSIEDCPFPANFEEVFLQEFHRRRDERYFAKMKRWFTGQWRSSDFRWGTFLGGATTATAIIALVVGVVGIDNIGKADQADPVGPDKTAIIETDLSIEKIKLDGESDAEKVVDKKAENF